jgi:hypothetical protein
MKNEWDEPTRLHPAADLAAKASQDVEEEPGAAASEGSTVLENRESLLARVQASMTVRDGSGERPPMPESLRKALSNLPGGAGGLPGSLPGSMASKSPSGPIDVKPVTPSRAFYTNEIAPDSTPVPIGDRGPEAREHSAEVLARHLRAKPKKRPLRSTLLRTGPFGMVAVVGFTVGMALREAPAPDAPRTDAVHVAPLAAPSSGIAIAPAGRTAAATPVRPAPATKAAEAAGVLRITTTPAGATVSMDGEPLTGSTPHILRLEPGRRVQLSAKLDGWLTESQQVTVEEGDHALELKLTAQKK